MWEFATSKQGALDEIQKRIIWNWITSDDEIIVTTNKEKLNSDELVKGLDYLVSKYHDGLTLYATEEKQWFTLTGRPKDGNRVGSFSFELLSVVSRAGEKGLTTIELSKMTGQDPRSLYGRVLTLVETGLVQRFPVIRHGAHTNLVVMKRFRAQSKEPVDESSKYSLQQIKHAIVSATKHARNGLRETEDLKMELKLNEHRRGNVIFNNATRILQASGYVTRVLVFRSDNENKKYKCIKYIKDLPDQAEDEETDEELDDVFDDMDDDIDDSKGSGSKHSSSHNHNEMTTIKDNTNGSQHQYPDLSDSSALIKMEDDEISETHNPILFNLFYPLENQIYDLIASSGIDGIPAMDLCERLVGRAFSRNVARQLTDRSNKPADGKKRSTSKIYHATIHHLGHLSIVRGIDFNARMKFYRYFTQPNYNRFVGTPSDPIWGIFHEIDSKSQSTTLQLLNSKAYVPLPGSMEILCREDGIQVPFFHGDKMKAPLEVGEFVTVPQANAPPGAMTTNIRKRGRPRKRPFPDDESVSSTSSPPNHSCLKRGRPRKTDTLELPTTIPHSTPSSTLKRGRGRPKKPEALSEQTKHDALPHQQQSSNEAVDVSLPIEEAAAAALSPTDADSSIIKHLQGKMNISNDPSVIDELLKEKNSEVSNLEQRNDNAKASIKSVNSMVLQGNISHSEAQMEILSFAEIKRNNQILELLKENNGIMEGGAIFLRKFNRKYSRETGSQIDRKTIEKCLQRLCHQGVIYRHRFDIPMTSMERYLIVDSSIVPDSSSINDFKSAVIESSKQRSDPTQEWSRVRIENLDFQYYIKTPPIPTPTDKAVERLQKQSKRTRKEKNKSKKKNDGIKESSVGDVNNAPIKLATEGTLIDNVVKDQSISEKTDQQAKSVKKAAKKNVSNRNTTRVPRMPDKQLESSLKLDTSENDNLSNVSNKFSKSRKKSILSDFNGNEIIEKKDREPMTTGSSTYQRAKRDPLTGRVKKQKSFRHADIVDSELFYRVIVITRSIYYAGGAINWEKIVEALPQYSLKIIKAKWPRIREKYGNAKGLALATKRWESFFLNHYEKGNIPPIEDFDNLNILFYAQFWIAHDKDILQIKSPWLCESISETLEQYNFVKSVQFNYIESFYSSPAMTKTDEILTNSAFGFSQQDPRVDVLPNDDVIVKAKQTIKAIIATGNEVYDPVVSEKYLASYGEKICSEAVAHMESEKSIVYVAKDREKVRPGRNYMFSERTIALLQPRLGEKVLDEATIFETGLINAIKESKGFIMSRTAPDSSLVSILDLVCHRQIDLVRVNCNEENVLVGYRSRAIDKNRLDCDIVLRSSPKSKIEFISRPTISEPLSPEPLGNIWTNVLGQLTVDIWKKIVTAILLTIALRPGIQIGILYEKFQSILTYKELGLVVKWLVARQSISEGECGGHYIKARWYSDVY